MEQKATFIDAHCHIDMCKTPVQDIISHATQAGVGIMITQGVNPASNRKALSLATKYPQIKVALGLYPIDALALSDEETEQELSFIRDHKSDIFAIGEVGMDFKEDLAQHARQEQIFRKIIALAQELDKPVIVHSRKAESACVTILTEMHAKKVIMHCFSGKFSLIKTVVENNWTLTIPTNVKNSEHFQKMIEAVPLTQLLCETDSPYLHPDKLPDNEPANVLASYEKIAEIKKESIEQVKNQLFENYSRLV